MIKATEMKKGMVVKMDNRLLVVVDYQHVKLGKGGAVLQTKFKDVLEGSTVSKRIRSEETLEDVYVDKQQYEYLYSSGDEHVFMHKETYDQITLGNDLFEEGPLYCKPNTDVEIQFFDGRALSIVLPNSVELEVTDTPPEIKGATATNQYKKATLETGLEITVPPFVKNGDIVRIDTRSGDYLERAK